MAEKVICLLRKIINPETRRPLFLALAVAGVVAVLHFTPLKQIIGDLQRWKTAIDEFGWIADIVFILTSTLSIAMGIPRLMLAFTAGTLFGFAEGIVIAICSGLIGSYAAFVTATHSTSNNLKQLLSGRESICKLIESPSILNIFFLRQLPIPALAINLILGLIKTPHQTFLIGTILGHLPSTAVVCSMGSAMGKQDIGTALKQVSWGMAALSIATFLIILAKRRLENP